MTLRETINGWVNIQVTVKEFNNPIKIANIDLANLNHTNTICVYLTLEDTKGKKGDNATTTMVEYSTSSQC